MKKLLLSVVVLLTLVPATAFAQLTPSPNCPLHEFDIVFDGVINWQDVFAADNLFDAFRIAGHLGQHVFCVPPMP